MNRGYIKIWRKIFDSGMQKEHETFTLWVWLLVNATRKELNYIVRGECIKLNPGEIIVGRKKLSIELGLSEKKVRTCLHHLETWGNVDISATKRFSILKIINWDIYQESDDDKGQQNGQERAKEGPRAGHKTRKRERENKDLSVSNETESVDCDPIFSKNGNVPYSEIQEIYNRICQDLPESRFLSDSRKKHIKSCWKQEPGRTDQIGFWEEFFSFIAKSDFLCGRTSKPFHGCSLEWATKMENFLKIREGKYNR